MGPYGILKKVETEAIQKYSKVARGAQMVTPNHRSCLLSHERFEHGQWTGHGSGSEKLFSQHYSIAGPGTMSFGFLRKVLGRM